ncbi:hypothetical protein SAMN06265360_1572 [Haloechinothrix alba]|uniref:Uncharacterized protein n=1 Tax=Haloechinothrix alba TaxID=664784 RepID=A0A239ATA9_9PSEU|nr:hypothetical protein SAMN06265360_1572 [Haloechinothrix alba]
MFLLGHVESLPSPGKDMLLTSQVLQLHCHDPIRTRARSRPGATSAQAGRTSVTVTVNFPTVTASPTSIGAPTSMSAATLPLVPVGAWSAPSAVSTTTPSAIPATDPVRPWAWPWWARSQLITPHPTAPNPSALANHDRRHGSQQQPKSSQHRRRGRALAGGVRLWCPFGTGFRALHPSFTQDRVQAVVGVGLCGVCAPEPVSATGVDVSETSRHVSGVARRLVAAARGCTARQCGSVTTRVGPGGLESLSRRARARADCDGERKRADWGVGTSKPVSLRRPARTMSGALAPEPASTDAVGTYSGRDRRLEHLPV